MPMRRGLDRATVALVALLTGATCTASAATAAYAAASPAASDGRPPAFADCSVVSSAEVSGVLGYDVLQPDANARTAGDCFYASQSISQEGSVAYSLVTPARLTALHPYFVALARRCANVASASSRAAACALYVKLAAAGDLDAYFAARTSSSDASPDAALGAATDATSAGDTLFVRQGPAIVEAAVRRDGSFDLGRSEVLARLLLSRLPR